MASLSNVTAFPVVNLASYRSAHAHIYKTNLELSRVDARPVVGGEIFAADSPHLTKLIYTLLEERQ